MNESEAAGARELLVCPLTRQVYAALAKRAAAFGVEPSELLAALASELVASLGWLDDEGPVEAGGRLRQELFHHDRLEELLRRHAALTRLV